MIQCDSGHINGDLIACARYRIYDLRAKADEDQTTHVLFIIHLPRQISSSLVGFQGEPWISAHIDDLKPTGEDVVELQDVINGACISDLFIGGIRENKGEIIIPYMFQNSNDTINDQTFDQIQKETMDISMEEVQNDDLVKSISTDHWALATDHAQLNVKKDYPEEMEIAVQDIEDVSFDEHRETVSLHSCEEPQTLSLSLEFDKPQVREISHPSIEPQAQIVTVEHIGRTTSFAQTQTSSTESACSVLQVQYKNPLFRRLHRCIQPAASRLKDLTMKRSTKRVELLVRLIPKDIPNDFGK